MKNNNFINEISFNNIKDKRIFFGHKSVGNNIISGVKDILLLKKSDEIRIVETNKPEDLSAPVFAHASNGINTDPKSKVDSFVNLMDNGLGKKVNIAFFKFCYVDIVSGTDVDQIFNYYREKMNYLEKKYPNVSFIHFTAPLSTYKRMGVTDKLKDVIKSITGKETNKEKQINNNIARNKYNELVRSTYNKDKIFDLAGYESTRTDGSKETITVNDIEYESLFAQYTYDGGHLNEAGRKIVAGQLLKFLEEMNK